MEDRLWYETPSGQWSNGLPIGNGRLAAMVWGDERTDRISLNHEWLWRGLSRYRDNEPVSDRLREVRESLRRGDFLEATTQANAGFGGGCGSRPDSYQPAGDLYFELSDCKDFVSRELDLIHAVAKTQRKTESAMVESVFIAHPGYGLIMGRWSAKAPFSGIMSYTRAEDENTEAYCAYGSDAMIYTCRFHDGIHFTTTVTLRTDGRVTHADQGADIHGATWIMAYINIGTSVRGVNEELAEYSIPNTSWEDILNSHCRFFSGLLGRLSLKVDLPEVNLPTDRRIQRIRAHFKGIERIGFTPVRDVLDQINLDTVDPTFPLLLFNFGRYLLASSSIGCDLPANLQGKWNDRIDPPWQSDYHFNINLQMNYWMAEAVNLSECVEPLIRYLERFMPHAAKAAGDLFGCRGIWLPHATDGWGIATPEGYGWAVWVGAAPWIAQHLWRHYEYSGDRDFLRDRAYPFFKAVALFYEDYLTEDEKGVLQIMPSQSPENRFEGTGDWPVSIGISSAMDVQLAYDALGYAIQSSSILETDRESRSIWQQMREHLPPFSIGSDGRLLEWDAERTEVEPGHRHLSHLYGMYPSDIFNPIDRPAQHEAAIRSLEYRIAHSDTQPSWSRVWASCLLARAGRGEEAWGHLSTIITGFTSFSLLDLICGPDSLFQIDANTGAAEAVLQSLVQCWGGKVHLLRALYPAWPTGSLRGVKAAGGHTLDIAWRNGRMKSARIVMGYSGNVVLAGLAGRYTLPDGAQTEDDDIRITGKPGEVFTLNSIQGKPLGI